MVNGIKKLARHIKIQLSNPESQHRQIAVGFLLVSIFVFMGKLVGAAKEVAIAWRYGVSDTVDAYVFVLNLVSWPVSIWFSILTMVLVPVIGELRRNNKEELILFQAELMGFTLFVGGVFAVFAALFMPYVLQSNGLGLSGSTLQYAIDFAYSLSLLIPLGAIISLLSVMLMASGSHRNTLYEAIPAFVLLVVLLVPSSWISEPLLWGTIAGFTMHAIALCIPLRIRDELPHPKVSFNSTAWALIWANVGIMAFGQILTSFTSLIDQFFAIGLSEGSLSSLNYANRILALILGLGATAVARATLPVFSDEIANGGGRVDVLAIVWFKWMFLLGALVAGISWFLAPWAVGVLYERGAFTANDTQYVASLLRIAMFQIVFYFPGLVMVSALAAQRRHSLIAISGVTNLLVKLPLSYLFMHFYGLHGLLMSTVVMYGVSSILLFLFATSRFSKTK